MDTISLTNAPINRRGGQNSYLLQKQGQFGSRNLVVTWVDCEPGGEQQMQVHEAEEQVYVVVRGHGLMKTGDEEQNVSAGTLIFVRPAPLTPSATPAMIRSPSSRRLTTHGHRRLTDYFAYKPQA
jgi:uncharacterized RmlC-like cupin family protein